MAVLKLKKKNQEKQHFSDTDICAYFNCALGEIYTHVYLLK